MEGRIRDGGSLNNIKLRSLSGPKREDEKRYITSSVQSTIKKKVLQKGLRRGTRTHPLSGEYTQRYSGLLTGVVL